MAFSEEEKKIFEKKQMEKARNIFLSNPYAYTQEEIQHGKEKENGYKEN